MVKDQGHRPQYDTTERINHVCARPAPQTAEPTTHYRFAQAVVSCQRLRLLFKQDVLSKISFMLNRYI